jgi:preprotein translocase SecE subunit
LLLLALTFWLAWRLVNFPAFADFLIATEAELNKVSWTTRKRLVQDTIVVLVTVFMMTAFLFVADMMWSKLLQTIGVLQPPPAEATKANEELPW